MPRPALGPVAVGDRLLVIRPYSKYRDNDPIPATVTKVGRVWINLNEVNGHRSWRLRLDTQNEGSQYSQQNRFVTPEQHAWEGQVSTAHEVLREAKATPDFGSRWRSDEERLLALAEFIRAYDEQHPTAEKEAM